MVVLGVVLLVLVEGLELLLEVAHLAEIAVGLGLFDLDFVLLDVIVDRLHAKTGRHWSELTADTIRSGPGDRRLLWVSAHPPGAA